MNDLVSVIMPVYNAENYIRQSIDSLLSQSYTNWELLAIDDLSKDNSKKVMNEYSSKDPRIHLIFKTTNSGSADTRNHGIKEAKGKYIAFLDSDDLWDKNFLESQIQFLKSNDASFVFSSYRNIDDSGNEILKPYIVKTKKLTYNKNLLFNRVGLLTAMYDVNALGKMYFDISLKSLRDDYALWQDILKKIKLGYGNPEILASFRHRKGSVTSSKKKIILPHFRMLKNREKLGFIRAAFYTSTHLVISYLKKYSNFNI